MNSIAVPAEKTYKLAIYGAADTVMAKRWATFTAAANQARAQVAATLPEDEIVWLYRDGEPHPIATDGWTAAEFRTVTA